MLDLDEEQSNEIAVQPNSSPFCPATATSEENSYFESISLISGTQQGQITKQLSFTPPESTKIKRSLCHEYSQINSLSSVLPEKRKRKIRQVTNI